MIWHPQAGEQSACYDLNGWKSSRKGQARVDLQQRQPESENSWIRFSALIGECMEMHWQYFFKGCLKAAFDAQSRTVKHSK